MSEDQVPYGEPQQGIDLESRVMAQQEMVSSLYARIIQSERTVIRRIDEQSAKLIQVVEARVNKLSDDLAVHFERAVPTRREVSDLKTEMTELREEMTSQFGQLQASMQQLIALVQGNQPREGA